MDSEPEGANLHDIRLALQELEVASSHHAFRISILSSLFLRILTHTRPCHISGFVWNKLASYLLTSIES